MAMQRNEMRSRPRRNRGRQELYNAKKPRKQLNWACCLLIAVIFIGSFVQIYNLACLIGQNKQISEETAFVRELHNQVGNAENMLLKHTNISVLQRRAAELGMIEADDCVIRRVPVTVTAQNSDTNAQTAYSGGNQ